jgi:lambda family phage tail tape measure protein
LIDTGAALQSESDQRQAAYADELALVLKQEDLAKGKKQLKALVDYQTQEKLIRQKMLDDQKQTIDSQEKLMESNMSKVAAYQDALANKLDTAKNASDISVSAIGTGSQETDQAARLNALQRDYDQQYASLQKSMQEHPQDAAVYKNELDALNAYQEARVALELSTNDRLAAARADWGNGWNRALQNYEDEVADKATQTANLFNDATKGMEDAWVTFATTGKLSFTSLANSVIADIIRMQARAAIASAASGISGFLGSILSFGSAATSALVGTGGTTLDSLTGSAASSAYSATGGAGNTYGFKFADGGAIVGPGTGTSDSILIRASNGEGILTADAMKRLGVPALNALNNGASINGLAKFATGGVVGSSAMSSVSSGSSNSGDVNISIEGGSSGASGGGYTPAELASLKKYVQAWVDDRIARKSSGQGGFGYNLRNGLAT